MITFGANLKINDNIYSKLPTEKSKTSVQNFVDMYQRFLSHPKVEALTKGDTIELRRAKHIGGYAVELEFTNSKLNEPYVTGIYTTEKEPNIKADTLIFQTLLYLCFKIGEKPRILENSHRFINRVLFNGKLDI